MQFDSEAALQAHCLNVLKSRGIEAQEEVWTNGIRADIVTPECVYELKKVLNRETLYQALGQATAYNQNLNRKYICIVGQSPSDPNEFQQAIAIAKAISNENIRVSFVDRDLFWSGGSNGVSNWFNLNLSHRFKPVFRDVLWMLGYGIVFALIIAVVVNSFAGDPDSRESFPTEQGTQ